MNETEIKTSKSAIASLICGIIGILIFLVAIPAIILGIISLVKIKENKGALKGSGLAIAGLVLGGLGITIFPIIIAISAAIIIPNLIAQKHSASTLTTESITTHLNNSKDDSEIIEDEIGERAHRFSDSELPAELKDLTLPPNPSKKEVREYVRKIMASEKNRRSFSSTDPEIDLLVKVGSANVDVLINALCQRDTPAFHIMEALKELVNETHKQLIIDNLEDNPGLAELVLDKNWSRDAKDILLKGLHSQLKSRQGRQLPPEWIQALAALQDQVTYEDLKQFLIKGPNKVHTYEAIKDLPGIDLAPVVATTWSILLSNWNQRIAGRNKQKPDNNYDSFKNFMNQWQSETDQWETPSMARIAIEFGHGDALEYIIDNIKSFEDWEKKKALSVVKTYTEYQGSMNGLMEWYAKNKADLVWDKEQELFINKNRKSDDSKPIDLKPADSESGTDSEMDGDEDENEEGMQGFPTPELPTELKGLTLPPNPSKKEVKEYVEKIMAADKKKKFFSYKDPEIDLLVKVGPANADILIKNLYRQGKPPNSHIINALKKVADETNKQLIIDNLKDYPELVDVIVVKKWSSEVRDILIKELRAKSTESEWFVSGEWIGAIVALRDTQTYDDLKKFFVHGMNKAFTYSQIKDLPGIDLATDVAEAWKLALARSKEKSFRLSTGADSNQWEADRMSVVAIPYGHIDALEYLVSRIGTDSFEEAGGTMEAIDLIKTHTEYQGEIEGLREWYDKNKDNLAWDKEQGKFIIKVR